MACACAAAALPPAGAAVPAPDLPRAVYTITIEAEYDPATRRLAGSERLRWNNTSEVEVGELVFHLYLNAFAHSRTTFMSEAAGGRRARRGEDGWGWIEVDALRLADGTDLKPAERFLRPDDGNPDDRTVASYPLPEPLPPGGWIEVDLRFSARLPHVFARTGAHGDYVLAGQWYPKIAVFEGRGARGRREAGWSAHQLHASGEFFADFGTYDVTLTLPARYRGRIGATGERVSETTAGERVTARFLQRGVHDFAWAADPRFEVVEARFDPGRDLPAAERRRAAELLGVEAAELALPPVELRLLGQPGRSALGRRYLAAARTALGDLGLRLGPYPFATLTLVDPAFGAAASGGMEYPTFVTLGTPALYQVPPLRGSLAPEAVTVHEVAHQWFQGLLASDGAEEAWLDEGPASYFETAILERAYGSVGVRLLGLELHHAERARRALARRPLSDAVAVPSWRFRDRSSWAGASYGRAALALRHLEGLVGPAPFARALRGYAREFRFRHPTGTDFERSLARGLGRDLGWFFRQALRSSRTLDYAVERLSNREVSPPEGEHPGRGAEPDPTAAGRWPPGRHFRASAEVVRRGEFRHPVEVEFRFDDGRVVRRRWDGGRRWARWTFTGPARVLSAEVDPERRLALDVDRLNNGRTARPDPAPGLQLLARLAFWLQNLFAATALFA